MKILMLTPYLPFPLYSGGQIRSYNLIKNLSRKHKITLFSFIRSDAEKVHLQELKNIATKSWFLSAVRPGTRATFF